jgi:hypothetical protein
MTKVNLKPLFQLVGADHKAWDEVLHSVGTSLKDRETKQTQLTEWHKVLVKTVQEIERIYSSLETLKIKEGQAARADERKHRQAEDRVSLRDFLSLPLLPDDGPLRTLHLTSRTGTDMRLDVLSFVGTGEGNIATVNRARELFQGGSVPQALWGLYYIKSGERSAGYGWGKPFLDEVFVHIHR